jgi:Putative adhesin
MNIKLLFFCLLLLCFSAYSQPKLLKQSTVKTQTMSFGAAGTFTINGSPQGSITIESWNKNELEITAEIEVQAENNADLALVSSVNGFVIDDLFNHIQIITIGMHDKDYMKKKFKKFPKRLLNLPWKIDYHVKVPQICDLEINAGRGDLKISGVEGVMQIKALETNAELNLVGGTINAVFGAGNVNVKIANRSWRGRYLDIQLATGTMNVSLPENLNAQVDASILKTGKIENLYTQLKPRERTSFSDKLINAKSGNGGALFAFTVGDGRINIQ